jgi:hypothetical protein
MTRFPEFGRRTSVAFPHFKDEPHADALIEVAQTYGKARAALDERAIRLFTISHSVSQ